MADKLRTIFHESITSVDCAQNIVVFKTLAGLAGGACEALDHMDVNGMVGTLAGENTVFVVMKDNCQCGDLLPGDPGNAVNHRQKPIPKGGRRTCWNCFTLKISR